MFSLLSFAWVSCFTAHQIFHIEMSIFNAVWAFILIIQNVNDGNGIYGFLGWPVLHAVTASLFSLISLIYASHIHNSGLYFWIIFTWVHFVDFFYCCCCCSKNGLGFASSNRSDEDIRWLCYLISVCTPRPECETIAELNRKTIEIFVGMQLHFYCKNAKTRNAHRDSVRMREWERNCNKKKKTVHIKNIIETC